MKREQDAAFLAELMVETGQLVGKKVVALITDMDQPLGTHVGNSLEVIEVLDVLRGGGPEDLRQLCIELAGWMLHAGGVAETPDRGKSEAEKLIKSGTALEKFRQMVELQGGDASVIDDISLLPSSKHAADVAAATSGFIAEIDCQAVGVASVILGGGRSKKEDSIDPSVGIVVHHKLGDAVTRGEPFCTIHYNSETQAGEAAALLQKSFRIAETAPAERKPLIRRVIGAPGETNIPPVHASAKGEKK
jgi:thymidine phosphorylase